MTRKDHAYFTAVAAAGALLALFQCWFMNLPLEEASGLDWCRFSPSLNCLETLHYHGWRLRLFGFVPVIPALLALTWFQLALCGFAWTARPAAREAWVAWARLASFPASGLAVYVLLRDYFDTRATSVSTIALVALCLGVNVVTVLQGLQGARLRAPAGGTLLVALFAVAFAGLVHGAGEAKRATADRLVENEAAPPTVRWPRFATAMPRNGAAALGSPRADAEVVLFVDPDDEKSRALMRELVALQADYGERVLCFVYAPGEQGARLIAAHRAGRLREHLAGSFAPDPADVGDLVARQQAAARSLGVEEIPAALWRGGRRSGSFDLRSVFAAATRP